MLSDALNTPAFIDFYEQTLIASFRNLNSTKPQKNHGFAGELRDCGNELFKDRDFAAALCFYNSSLRYEPAESQEVSLVYGNRSAVYCEMGKYALALENIALARKNGYPAEKMARLNAREEKCKKLMEEFGPDKNFNAESFFKLSHPPNEKIPFIAGCLELHKNEKYGRHIITNTDLKTGDIIAIEKPAFAWLNFKIVFEIGCLFCTKANSGSLIPCSHCTTVMFCSEECREKAAQFHLDDELSGIYSGNCEKILKMQLEAYRIAGGVDEALELLKDAADKTIFDFDFSDPNDPNYEKNMLIALNGLCKVGKSREITEIKPEFFNIPIIKKRPRTTDERRQLLKFIISQVQICSANLTIYEGDHGGIFLLQSLINHSCIPNVDSVKLQEKSVLMVARPIKAGEQLFNCLEPNVYAALFPKEERLGFLQDYQIKCDCNACVNDWPQPFPRKDRRFIEPTTNKITPVAAIEQFKKNCKYIDKNAKKMPCYEVPQLMINNNFLAFLIGGYNFNKIK